MPIDVRELRRLSNLELSKYAGELDALEGDDEMLVAILACSPLETKVVADKGICDAKLYKIGLQVQGEYETFAELRRKVMDKLSQTFQPPAWNLLSVLFDGIYIGEPEDLYNFRAGESQGIIYHIKGLGTKLADVRFL